VIEDEPDIQLLIKMALEFTRNDDVLLASEGPAGLELARTENPDFILLDAMMPGMDGYEVCHLLKEDPDTSDIPVIFLTAKAQVSEIEQGLRLGATGYLTKPFDPMRLNEDLEALLNARR
jgi:CheY-like chemotaxis protein